MNSRFIFWISFLFLSALFGLLFWFVPQMRVKNVVPEPDIEVSITIPEGRNFRQISQVLVRKHLASTLRDVEKAQSEIIKEGKFKWLDSLENLEGYLFPDTYRFYKDSDAKGALEAMLKNFEKKAVTLLTDERVAQDLSVREIVILASIIERESTKEDMGMIADIFIRRLRAGIPLQADSTVNYITGLNKPAISAEEKNLDSPYNTYKYKGLPRGPISNPGLASIRAVLHPSKNDYWYFLSTKDGRIIYSRTLEEHNRQKAAHLR